MELRINGLATSVEVEPDTPLLWVLRDEIGLKGTKFGCGVAQCGVCTVHLNGQPVPSCSIPVSAAEGAEITTIEGLSDDVSHPVQRAWIELDVPQCGYCQSGQIMTTVALLAGNPDPSDEQIDAYLSRNLCRCGTYPRIRAAVRRAAELSRA